MAYEVEQKFRIAAHAVVADQLLAMGAQGSSSVAQIDAYFNHPSWDFAQTGEALRLRRVGDNNAITYKGPKLQGPTKTRPEYEVPFATGGQSLETMRAVLEMLGFRPVAEIHKQRASYSLTHQGRRLEVVLDEVDGLGRFVEVETIAADAVDLPAAQAAVIDLSRALGLTDYEPRSYLRMVLEMRAGEAKA